MSDTFTLKTDLILHNGNILTLDDNLPTAQAIAIRGNKILAVGTNEEILALVNSNNCNLFDLKNRTVIPGLIDGHAHLDREGLKDIFPSLGPVKSITDIQEQLAKLVKDSEKNAWIVTMPLGTPPSYTDMPQALAEQRFPNRYDLDVVAPDHPVYIRAIWGFWRHTTPLISIANSKALELAGIGPNTQSPSSQVTIEKDENGVPTGVFREETLMPLVELTFFREATRFSLESRVQSIPSSAQAYHAYGTTSVYEGHGAASELIKSYQDAHAAGNLTMRVNLAFSPNWKSAPVPDINAFIEAWCGWLNGSGLGNDYLRVSGMFIDIGKDSDNELRAEAYPSTGWAGFNYDTALTRENVLKLLIACARNKIQVIAIWPNMLDLFYETHKQIPLNGQRWVLSHISTLSPYDIQRISEMGLIVTTHTNRYLYKEGELLHARLGTKKEQDIVPIRSLLDAGVPVSLASDNVPVSLFHPMWHAVTRETRDSGIVISAQQKISRIEALRCMTSNGALLTWEENKKGALTTGKLADLAILNLNPLTCPESEIKDIKSILTIVGGQIVYQDPEELGKDFFYNVEKR